MSLSSGYLFFKKKIIKMLSSSSSLNSLLFALCQPFNTHQSKIYLHTTVPFHSGHSSATCCKAKQLNPPPGYCLYSPALQHQSEAYFGSLSVIRMLTYKNNSIGHSKLELILLTPPKVVEARSCVGE